MERTAGNQGTMNDIKDEDSLPLNLLNQADPPKSSSNVPTTHLVGGSYNPAEKYAFVNASTISRLGEKNLNV